MRNVFVIIIVGFLSSVSYAQNISIKMDSLINGLVAEKKLHGCVTYIQKEGELIQFKPYGYKCIERNDKMDTNTIFRIASMTKVLVSAGALKLYEDGYFLLDDPVSKYINQFKNMKVVENLSSDSAKIFDSKREITIRDLFRHTAGFGMEYTAHENNDTIDKLYIANKLSSTQQTSKDFINNISKIPLKYQPGSKWLYSYSTDILGFLIETITHKTLQQYLNEALFVPCEMNSTGFYVKREDVKRFSANYYYNGNKLVLLDDPLTSDYLNIPTIYSGGGGFENNEGGIVTTARDFANFCNMILNYGAFNNKRILNAQTIELMISNQISNITDMGFKVSGYGLGVGVSTKENNGATKSIFWSGGPYNTTFTIDFEKKMIAIFLTQNSPWWHLSIIEKFNNIVNQ